MDVKIKSGKFEVLTSGTIISFSGNPVDISFGSLKLIFKFNTDDSKKGKYGAETSVSKDKKTLTIVLTNFDNPLGAGTLRPVPAGTWSGRRVYLHYRIYPLEEGDKTIHYTIYLGEEVSKEEDAKEKSK